MEDLLEERSCEAKGKGCGAEVDDLSLQFELARTTRIPSPMAKNAPRLSDEERIDAIADRFGEIMQLLGLDVSDPSLAKTPQRVAKMYVNEIFFGLNPENFPDITLMDAQMGAQGGLSQSDQLVSTKVTFTSFCEHHFVPIHGTAYIAYIPRERIIGLSKINRVVRYFAKRPQMQERFTAQVVDSLTLLLDTEDVAISVAALHDCVVARGVEDNGGFAVTQKLCGRFNSDAGFRQQFLGLIQNTLPV